MAKRKGRADPFATYIEWAQHRYDPGHYLGGTLEPHLRKSSLGPRARRRSGIMLAFIGLFGVVSVGTFAAAPISGGGTFDRVGVLGELTVSLLFVFAGVVMFRSAAQGRSKGARK